MAVPVVSTARVSLGASIRLVIVIVADTSVGEPGSLTVMPLFTGTGLVSAVNAAGADWLVCMAGAIADAPLMVTVTVARMLLAKPSLTTRVMVRAVWLGVAAVLA